MSSPVRQSSSSGRLAAGFRGVSDLACKVESPMVRAARGLTAFSLEFVAKPDEAASALLNLPAAIHSGLEDLPGFAGSLVMVSDQEARLITVIIFWDGTEARRNCERIVRRVRALLAPYMDRCLRVQNMLAQVPAASELYSQPSSIDTRLIAVESIAEEANVCAA